MIAGARPRPDGGTPEERDQDLAAALASGRAVRLEPTEPLASGTSYLLRCGPGLRPRDGGEGLAKAHDEAFTTYGAGGHQDRRAARPGHRRRRGADQDRVRHPDGSDPGAQARAPAIAGRPRGGAGPVGQLPAHGVHLVGRPGAGHQLPAGRSTRGWSTPSGSRIEEERRHDFRVGDASPRAGVRDRHLHGRARERPATRCGPATCRGWRCAARRVPEARLAAVLTGPANYDAWWDAASRGSVEWKQLGLARRTTELRPDAARNRWHDQTLDLAATCGAPAAGGGRHGRVPAGAGHRRGAQPRGAGGPARAAVAGQRHRPGPAGQGGQRLVADLGGAAVDRGPGGGRGDRHPRSEGPGALQRHQQRRRRGAGARGGEADREEAGGRAARATRPRASGRTTERAGWWSPRAPATTWRCWTPTGTTASRTGTSG